MSRPQILLILATVLNEVLTQASKPSIPKNTRENWMIYGPILMAIIIISSCVFSCKLRGWLKKKKVKSMEALALEEQKPEYAQRGRVSGVTNNSSMRQYTIVSDGKGYKQLVQTPQFQVNGHEYSGYFGDSGATTLTRDEIQSLTLMRSENPNLMRSENPTLTRAENPTLTRAENPNLTRPEHSTLKRDQTPSLKRDQNPTLVRNHNSTIMWDQQV